MSGDHPPLPETADELRQLNRELDRQLASYLDKVDADPTPAAPDAWSMAQILAHVGEFAPFFSEQIAGWLEDRDRPMGRTTSHAGRLAAVDPQRVAGLTRADLEAGLEAARAATEAVLDRLVDADLTSPTQNVKYGTEPLTAFLTRYLVGHKREHVTQLRAVEEAAR